MTNKLLKQENSISGMSAAMFITKDDSLSALVISHGIQVRDFILLSFLSDQGPMTVERLARTVGMDPAGIERSIRRLSAANLVMRDPVDGKDRYASVTRLTGRGENVAARISQNLS